MRRPGRCLNWLLALWLTATTALLWAMGWVNATAEFQRHMNVKMGGALWRCAIVMVDGISEHGNGFALCGVLSPTRALRARRGAPRPRGWAGYLAKSKENTHTHTNEASGTPQNTAVSTRHWLPPRNMCFPSSRQFGPICGVLIVPAVIITLIF